jgi:hypothetical protein
MKATIPIVICCALALCFSCKKSEEKPPAENEPQTLSLSGVTDVDLYDYQKNKLRVTVHSSDSSTKEVTLAVSGLPSGITAVIDTVRGTPPFSTTISFRQKQAMEPGAFTASVSAISDKETVSQHFELSIGTFNGWVLNDTLFFYADTMYHYTHVEAPIFIRNYSNNVLVLIFVRDSTTEKLLGGLKYPGTYTVPIRNATTQRSGLIIEYDQGRSRVNDTAVKYATLTVATDGRLSIKVPPVKITDYAHMSPTVLTIDAHE